MAVVPSAAAAEKAMEEDMDFYASPEDCTETLSYVNEDGTAPSRTGLLDHVFSAVRQKMEEVLYGVAPCSG